MKNKKILIICTSLNLGGAEKKAVWLANSLSKNNTVYFFSLKSSGVLSDYLNEEVIIKNFNLVRSKNLFSKIFYVFIGWFRIVKVINENEIRNVISFLFHSNLYAKLAKIFAKKKFNHIIAVRSDRLSRRKSNQSKLRMFLFKYFIVDKNSKIVFNSLSGLERFKLNKKYVQKIIFNSPENSPNFELIKNNKFVFVGRLDELKNVMELVKAINYLNKKGKSIFLDIFGKGPNYPYIESYISKNNLKNVVSLKGQHIDISDNLHSYKSLILVSTHEGFPNVLIEAMNSKINCISTNVGDVSFLLSQNRGILVDGFDYLSIANSIEYYLRLDENTKNEMIKESYNFVKNNLNEESILKEWVDLIS